MFILIRKAKLSDLDKLVEIENICFPEKERETRKIISERIETFNEGFLVAEVEQEIVAMINCCATNSDSINQEEFEKIMHFPSQVNSGKNQFLVSIEVLPEFQGNGIANLLLERMIMIAKENKKKKILLVCKEPLIELYKKIGFIPNSDQIKYGNEKWFGMELEL